MSPQSPPPSARLARDDAAAGNRGVGRRWRREIDVVIRAAGVLARKWQQLYDEISPMRAACGEAHLQVISAPAPRDAQKRHARLDGGMMGVRFRKDLDRQGSRQTRRCGGSHGAARSAPI